MKAQFFGDYLERLESMDRSLHQEVEGLPAEAMDWTPGQEMNSIAVLMEHIAGSLRFWMGDVALGDPSGRVRSVEFETRGRSSAEVLAHMDSVLDYARSNLDRMSLDELDEVRPVEGEERAITRGWALLHALDHATLHLGQVQLTAQMWRQRGKTP